MITIEHSDIFREEYTRFQNGISEITDPDIKNELTNLLSKLLYEVRMIDSLHVGMDIHAQLQETAPVHRNKLMEIRLQLDRRLKDWRSRQPLN
jgi:hypothetical protein